MSQVQEPDYDSIEYPELPRGWEWRTGSAGASYYTKWFGTKYLMGGNLAGKHGLGGYDGEVYWDIGGLHHVSIRPVEGIRENGDPVFGYDKISRSFETMQEAINAVPDLIEELKE